jgi:hypothetical protein
MSTKAKPNAALAALAKVQVLQPSQTPLAALLPTATPEKRIRARAPETLLSKPTALNLYPDDQDKIEETISYLRSKGCQGVSKSRVAQLAIRELMLNEQTVATFLKLPDYRDKKTL